STMPSPPISTLFPYTTLFRSLGTLSQRTLRRPQRFFYLGGVHGREGLGGIAMTDVAPKLQRFSLQRPDGSAALRARQCRRRPGRSEEHTSELQSRENLVCRLL